MKTNTLTRKFLKNNIAGYVSKDQKADDLKNYLRLDLGENLLGCSPKVLEAIKTIGKKDLRFYTDPSGTRIKNIIAELYKVSPQEITIANSSNEIIDFLPKMVLEKDDLAVVIAPTFFRFQEAIISAGGKPLYIYLNETDDFNINNSIIEQILKNIKDKRVKIIWICNPNNPTGGIWQLNQIRKIVTNTKALVIIDEAFFEYCDPDNKKSAVTLVKKHPNMLVLRTLSKAYGLAGLRFGYAIANQKTIQIIESYRNTLLMTSAFTQKLAESAFSDQKFLQKTVKKTAQLRQDLFRKIGEIDNLHLGSESKTNVYLLKHKKKDLYQELLKRKVKTADFRDCQGLKGKEYVRITIADKASNHILLNVLKRI